MCQEFPKEKWIDAQKENVLDAPYYHVVFTVPEELNPHIHIIVLGGGLDKDNKWKDTGGKFFSPVWGHCKSVPWEIFVRIKKPVE